VEELSEWMNALFRLIGDTEYRNQLSLNAFKESKRKLVAVANDRMDDLTTEG
jgi:hypothetical protein